MDQHTVNVADQKLKTVGFSCHLSPGRVKVIVVCGIYANTCFNIPCDKLIDFTERMLIAGKMSIDEQLEYALKLCKRYE